MATVDSWMFVPIIFNHDSWIFNIFIKITFGYDLLRFNHEQNFFFKLYILRNFYKAGNYIMWKISYCILLPNLSLSW